MAKHSNPPKCWCCGSESVLVNEGRLYDVYRCLDQFKKPTCPRYHAVWHYQGR